MQKVKILQTRKSVIILSLLVFWKHLKSDDIYQLLFACKKLLQDVNIIGFTNNFQKLSGFVLRNKLFYEKLSLKASSWGQTLAADWYIMKCPLTPGKSSWETWQESVVYLFCIS